MPMKPTPVGVIEAILDTLDKDRETSISDIVSAVSQEHGGKSISRKAFRSGVKRYGLEERYREVQEARGGTKRGRRRPEFTKPKVLDRFLEIFGSDLTVGVTAACEQIREEGDGTLWPSDVRRFTDPSSKVYHHAFAESYHRIDQARIERVADEAFKASLDKDDRARGVAMRLILENRHPGFAARQGLAAGSVHVHLSRPTLSEKEVKSIGGDLGNLFEGSRRVIEIGAGDG